MDAASEQSPARKTASLRTAILLPLAVIILVGFMSSWTFYVLASRVAVGDAVERLVQETTAVAESRLSRLLEKPKGVGVAIAEFVRQVDRPEEWSGLFQRMFRSQLAEMPELNIAAIGFSDGEYTEAQRLGDGTILLGRAGRATGGALESWTCSENGTPLALYASKPGYDPRTRPWYLQSARQKTPGWSEIYSYYSNADLAISATYPILAAGKVRAVVSVTMTLRGIHDFLNTMPQARTGVLAVLDRAGRLIAVSGEDLDTQTDEARPRAADPLNYLLTENAGRPRPDRSAAGRVSRFRLDGARYVAATAPLSDDDWNLGWSVAAVLPESDFTERMLESDVQGGFVFLLLMSLALLVTWLTVGGVVGPLSHLETAVKDLASARFSEESGHIVKALSSRTDEIGRLAESFENMRGSLEAGFENLRANLAEKEVLLKEVHHRVKNNLQVISSILSIQSDELEDPKALEAFEACQERIQAMAFVHEGVYQSGLYSEVEMDDYFGRICTSLRWSRGDGAPGIDVGVREGGVRLPLAEAIPCGLIVNELAVNALKHAFPGRSSGSVSVSLTRSGGRYLLVVEDDGVGAPAEGGAAQGIGRTLVDSLVAQLKGSASSIPGPEGRGLRMEIRFG